MIVLFFLLCCLSAFYHTSGQSFLILYSSNPFPFETKHSTIDKKEEVKWNLF
jgi:hypothetical protein